MSVRREAGSADARLIEAYEALRRRHSREGSSGAGHEVLRRQGLAAWIEAFSGCQGAAMPEPPASPSSPPFGRTVTPTFSVTGDGSVPENLYPELTRLVAGLALQRLTEGP